MLLSGIGIDIPAGGVVLTSKTVDHLDDRRSRCQRCLGRVPRPAGREGSADRGDARRRRRHERQQPPSMVIGARSSPASVHSQWAPVCSVVPAWLRSVLGALLVFIGVAVLGPVLARPISRVIGAPLPRLKGMSGTLGSRERDAQPEADVGDRRGA